MKKRFASDLRPCHGRMWLVVVWLDSMVVVVVVVVVVAVLAKK